ncbi:hypothetical protein K445DRAFT_323570 [Daldinia sp. EC12]|nr:hypothetical protein K445DRAFT_323570 [Daldinia sp. EC12]
MHERTGELLTMGYYGTATVVASWWFTLPWFEVHGLVANEGKGNLDITICWYLLVITIFTTTTIFFAVYYLDIIFYIPTYVRTYC